MNALKSLLLGSVAAVVVATTTPGIPSASVLATAQAVHTSAQNRPHHRRLRRTPRLVASVERATPATQRAPAPAPPPRRPTRSHSAVLHSAIKTPTHIR